MARRPDELVTLTCPLSEMEQDFVAQMMRLTNIGTQCNLVRLGLWHLAKHLDVPVGSAFGQWSTQRTRQRTKKRVWVRSRLTAKAREDLS